MSSLQSEYGLVHLRHLTTHLQLIVWMLGTNVFEVQPALPPSLLCSPPPHCKVLPLLFQISLSIINLFSHPLSRAPLLSPPLPFFTLRLIDSLPFSPAPPSGFSATTWHQFHSEYSFAPPVLPFFPPHLFIPTVQLSSSFSHLSLCDWRPFQRMQGALLWCTVSSVFSDECQNSTVRTTVGARPRFRNVFLFLCEPKLYCTESIFLPLCGQGMSLSALSPHRKQFLHVQHVFFTCIVCHNSLFDEWFFLLTKECGQTMCLPQKYSNSFHCRPIAVAADCWPAQCHRLSCDLTNQLRQH